MGSSSKLFILIFPVDEVFGLKIISIEVIQQNSLKFGDIPEFHARMAHLSGRIGWSYELFKINGWYPGQKHLKTDQNSLKTK